MRKEMYLYFRMENRNCPKMKKKENNMIIIIIIIFNLCYFCIKGELIDVD